MGEDDGEQRKKKGREKDRGNGDVQTFVNYNVEIRIVTYDPCFRSVTSVVSMAGEGIDSDLLQDDGLTSG